MEDASSARNSGVPVSKHGTVKEIIEEKAEEYDIEDEDEQY
jgi:hypothetical protein